MPKQRHDSGQVKPDQFTLAFRFRYLLNPIGKQMYKILTIAALAALSLNVQTAMAGDAAAGKSRAAACSACHGANGISSNGMWPNLAGQKEVYLVSQLKAFRDGDRKNPMMAPMAAGLSDDDIANLAAYYASLGK
jgi:cytochrome c553